MAFSFGDFQSGEVEQLLASAASSQQHQQQHHHHDSEQQHLLQFGAGGQDIAGDGLKFQQLYSNGTLGGQAASAVAYTTPQSYGEYVNGDQLQPFAYVGEGVSYGTYITQGQKAAFYGNGYTVPPTAQQQVAVQAVLPQTQDDQPLANGVTSAAATEEPCAVGAIAVDVISAPKAEANGVRDAAAAVAAATNVERHIQNFESVLTKKRPQNPNDVLYVYPRGLKNTGNSCFMNATLQALLSSEMLIRALTYLRVITTKDLASKKVSMLDTMIEFLDEFRILEGILPGHDAHSLREYTEFEALTPSMFAPILEKFSSRSHAPGLQTQEDAQEFLCFLLNELDEELKRIADSARKSTDEEVEAEGMEHGGWEEVGKKNRSSLTRKTEVSRSVMHKLFWGEYRSTVRVKRHGVKPSITVEPFLILTLDLTSPNVSSVEDALYQHVEPEVVEYRHDDQDVEAQKYVKFQELPMVLLLQLNRCTYRDSFADKIETPIRINSQLIFGKELLEGRSASLPQSSRTFNLVSLINHKGHDSNRGHYTAVAKRGSNASHWAHFDDDIVTSGWEDTLLDDSQMGAYLLVYEREQ